MNDFIQVLKKNGKVLCDFLQSAKVTDIVLEQGKLLAACIEDEGDKRYLTVSIAIPTEILLKAVMEEMKQDLVKISESNE